MRWSIHGGFLASGFITFPGTEGTGVSATWTNTLPSARTAPHAIRYSNGDSTSTPATATCRFVLPLPDGDNVALSLQAATDLAAANTSIPAIRRFGKSHPT